MIKKTLSILAGVAVLFGPLGLALLGLMWVALAIYVGLAALLFAEEMMNGSFRRSITKTHPPPDDEA